ncbi:2-amino-4-hydroxy-6-hydroxymethyldihydropteridine diphosphokinase [Pelagibius litoralis]|uniref:2-amino-4-hydroxy-6-hydroxymethyldihydropteridine pyrophosphokinase n=1 Tax=Pelagibius litoralis TaxID=374515 RepID=A0A967EUH1_9PROT|nr:2-amino-4-hydroxy-6-hydroxymethyldihydropteridine diphosphokinase [Pelagibius litoralis]
MLVALGSNLESAGFGGPRQTLEAALDVMPSYGIAVIRKSSWYSSAPVPTSSQPWFVNGVICVETSVGPSDLLAKLHAIEERFGRKRIRKNECRTLDLDLLAFGESRLAVQQGLMLPHPRIAERAFVLQPIDEIAPAWRHPVTGETAADMLSRLPGQQRIRRLGTTS